MICERNNGLHQHEREFSDPEIQCQENEASTGKKILAKYTSDTGLFPKIYKKKVVKIQRIRETDYVIKKWT